MDQTLDIEVTISQELRDLLTGRMRSEAPEITRPVTVVPEAIVPVSEPGWQKIRLRRDGQRPLQFDGLPVVRFSGPLTLGEWDCEQDVALYLDRHGDAYLALALHMPETAPVRPVHQTRRMDPANAESWLRDWTVRIRSHAAHSGSPGPLRDDALSELSVRLQALTEHSFRAGVVPQERNEPCLQ